MTEKSLITAEMKSMIGQEIDLPSTEAIDKASILRYARAISDFNPLYSDEEYANQAEYGGIIAPPTFLFDVVPATTDIGDDGRDLTRIKLPGFKPAIRASNEYQLFESARPGDVINRKRKIINIYEREGKRVGKIVFVVYDTTYTNQKGRILGINRETLMFFK